MIDLPVRSSRLVIDALTIGDAAAVAAYRNDPDVARFQGWSLPYGAEDAAGLAAAGNSRSGSPADHAAHRGRHARR